MGYRQVILIRKDLNMGTGKACAQSSHASMEFLIRWIKSNADLDGHIDGWIDQGIFDNWINDIFTKTICEAKNKNHLMKAVAIAENLGLKEGEDFFLIKDCCLTELEPEEIDENGVGRTLTCIGFRPLPDEITHQISKKYQLYK